MKLAIVLSLCFVSYCSSASVVGRDIETEWGRFKNGFRKSYGNSASETKRKGIFAQNLAAIDAHNRAAANDPNSFKMALNKYADLVAKINLCS